MKRMITCAADYVYKPSELRPQMKEIVRTLKEYISPIDMDVDNNFLLCTCIGPIRYSYTQLSTATGNFSNNYSLGQGSFGQVYKGCLDGGICAIKKLFYPKGFEDGIKFLSCVRHQHLVTMVGYCIEKANALIVLEYLPNKSLRSHLHESNSLDWLKRMKIVIGSAKRLEYLHEHCNLKIIHQNIKSDNILLNNNFELKVADFGLSLFLPDTTFAVLRIND
ncbi:proline-rich receptor-like protein kinase PERK15 [Hevea brasiliensis]|uniref:proline-rich receptor-like protein kinase PERK15 n=1 Tax=Hevea brasiliensis TaxID=3981 RepID=UPI0025E32391|nr:proline-rich receptor-like protein kinase PERK15 [Hevea brasiliensis]